MFISLHLIIFFSILASDKFLGYEVPRFSRLCKNVRTKRFSIFGFINAEDSPKPPILILTLPSTLSQFPKEGIRESKRKRFLVKTQTKAKNLFSPCNYILKMKESNAEHI